ncbi:RDD family protein [Pleomorphomonas sp. NRK KF1]|uniref:RDD family protein n=1 Tax=Pleomorphomonas sp. NRK KF1 TaxID=2943000 RepID=UPI00204301B3|nr:RDD family protein [Pleomorphomonas sp. NRK KF1]MCM5555768.1 RDD family protein [Pleomorphomonas sp. NRK KF1]
METDSRPKRYFWRRLGAFLIDFALAYALAVVILMTVDAVTGGDFYYWKGVYSQTACVTAPPSPLLDELNKVLPAVPDWQRTEVVCRTLPAGGKPSYVLTVKNEIREGKTTRLQYVGASVTASGDRLNTSLQLDPTVSVAYLFMLAWARYFGRSPGKRFLRLTVRACDCGGDTSPHLLRREFFRLGPLLLFSLVGVAAGLTAWWFVGSMTDYLWLIRQMLDAPIAWAVPNAVLSLALAVYYLFPFLRWRGQAFYDRFAGTVVVKD